MKENYWKGKLVTLRSIEIDDAEFFYAWNQETQTQKHLDQVWFPSSKLRQEEWVKRMAVKDIADDSFFFVLLNLKGEKVGMIHTHDCDKRNGNFSYGLGIIQEQRNKGFAVDAIKLVLNYYFNELRYHKAIVSIYEFNHASIKLHEKLGYVQEGRLREMVFQAGKHHDLLKFGLLKREFKE